MTKCRKELTKIKSSEREKPSMRSRWTVVVVKVEKRFSQPVLARVEECAAAMKKYQDFR